MLSRVGSSADRALGEDFTYLFVNRFKNAIVDSISDAVTIAVLDEVADVLGRGTYTRNISRALREHETHLREMLFETMRQDPKAGRLSRLRSDERGVGKECVSTCVSRWSRYE